MLKYCNGCKRKLVIDIFSSHKKSTCRHCVNKKVECTSCGEKFISTKLSKLKEQRHSTYNRSVNNNYTYHRSWTMVVLTSNQNRWKVVLTTNQNMKIKVLLIVEQSMKMKVLLILEQNQKNGSSSYNKSEQTMLELTLIHWKILAHLTPQIRFYANITILYSILFLILILLIS